MLPVVTTVTVSRKASVAVPCRIPTIIKRVYHCFGSIKVRVSSVSWVIALGS